jgi:hypothetical protein
LISIPLFRGYCLAGLLSVSFFLSDGVFFRYIVRLDALGIPLVLIIGQTKGRVDIFRHVSTESQKWSKGFVPPVVTIRQTITRVYRRTNNCFVTLLCMSVSFFLLQGLDP